MKKKNDKINDKKNEEDYYITVKGARANNLRNIDVRIPREKFVVITGLSGSGKSSLAFDTLYAEGQRRYVESLSAYARQFLGRMSKPECDYIKGIPPAIAIEQKVSVRNPRSTVGTSTEIYEYLRLLFARVGKTVSPVTGEVVKKHQTKDVVDKALSYPAGTRFAIYAPLVMPDKGRTLTEQFKILMKEGFTRVEIQNKTYRIEEALKDSRMKLNDVDVADVEIPIDRLTVSDDKLLRNRLGDSVETAFFEGHNVCRLKVFKSPEESSSKVSSHKKSSPQEPKYPELELPFDLFEFSKHFEADGIEFEEPTELMFNFNNPMGACPVCEGFGRVVGVDERLVVSDSGRSVYDGAVVCWRGDVMGEWLQDFITASAKHKFPIHRPYFELNEKEKDLLWHGAEGVKGIDDFFAFVEKNLYKIQYRVMNARYRGRTACPRCKGTRLKPTAMYVRVGGKNIAELVAMPVSELIGFFDKLRLDATDAVVAKRLLIEITNRLQFLMNVGLGYLTLDRLSATLSGGESQRISLATALGSSLVGSLYILDEPSIGLHSRDTGMLLQVLRELQALGNTVVVVEHDEAIIRAADYIIDIGPDAGRLGGEVVYQGAVADLQLHTDSHTVRYLTGEDSIQPPALLRPWNQYIEIQGARANNLKHITVRIPLHVMTVVTGVSGSGKSTLVRDVFYEGMKRILDDAPAAVECTAISGDTACVKVIEFVDQNSIGKSTRSNPVTYIGAYDEIRALYAELPLAKQMGYSSAYFSFNKEGGRCEECKGEGRITVEMQFMADLKLECELCHGKRFKPEVLEALYHGVSIFDMLEMTVNQAIEFLSDKDDFATVTAKIVRRLRPLQEVGLGYIKLGQTSSTLSGGENQRVKLAYYLVQEKHENTLFIFDEPTTGLHFHDIKTLLRAFNALIDRGHTVVIIEHHPDIIKCADYIIDLGPEGGRDGGHLVFAGKPQDIIACKESYTGKALKLMSGDKRSGTRI
ncbi:MAG: excinuclease ABC subunit UvrA [Tannerella sp.]|jgi:excinuclease ABC subunit A|nr:excinuclease ABC subunit UvrA [Tannerella sp.]